MTPRRARRPRKRRAIMLKRWFTRLKRRLGYYEARARFWKRPFLRSLRPTDVFLVGHPKSGNTWVAYMLAILLDQDRAKDVNLVNVGQYVPFVHGRDHHIAKYRHLPDPRIFRNEYPRYWDLYPRIIYLVRDPRALLVSLWHMYRVMYDEHDLTLASFVDQYLSTSGLFLDWNRGLVRWDRQVQATVTEAARDPRILVLKYEDLVRDRRGTLERLAGFVGIERSPADLAVAVDRGDFASMQALEDRHGAEAYEGRAAGEGRFVRAGKVDGWPSEMDPQVAALIERHFGLVMKLVGYLD